MRAIVGLLSLIVLIAGHAAHAQTSQKREVQFVDSLGREVIEVISDKSRGPGARERDLRSIFERYVDVEWVARFVLGANWRAATEDQRTRYLAAYSPYIVKTYASRFSEYTGETIAVTGNRQENDGSTTVFAYIDRKEQPDIKLQFRVGEIKGQMRVMDIVVEGVSQLNTQRSEFNAVVSRKGLDYLISRIEERAGVATSSRPQAASAR